MVKLRRVIWNYCPICGSHLGGVETASFEPPENAMMPRAKPRKAKREKVKEEKSSEGKEDES